MASSSPFEAGHAGKPGDMLARLLGQLARPPETDSGFFNPSLLDQMRRVLIDHARARLAERFPGVSFVPAAKRLTGHPASDEILGRLQDCDVVINALGD
mgnify:CR=1 FL=1